LARDMLRRAFEAGVPARWVVADTVYGMTRGLRRWLEKRERSYVLAVTSSKSVYYEGTQRRVGKVARSLPEDSWIRASAGKGTKGERLYDWACVELPQSGMYRKGVRAGRWLLMRRSIAGGEPEEEEEEKKKKKIAYYLCYGPAHTSVEELIRIAGRRWVIEDCFEQAKGEVGLDEYEVRKWDGWHRHITLCLLAHAYLAVVRSVAEQEEDAAKGGISSRIRTPS
jgi:SRSO17 transposase